MRSPTAEMRRDGRQMWGTMHARLVEADLGHQIGKLRYVAKAYPGTRVVIEGVIAGLERDRGACNEWAAYGQAVTDEAYARELMEKEAEGNRDQRSRAQRKRGGER